MGLFSLLFGKYPVTCPRCGASFDVKAAKNSGEVEVLGKDIEGYLLFTHKGCGADIKWDTLTNKMYESNFSDLEKQ